MRQRQADWLTCLRDLSFILCVAVAAGCLMDTCPWSSFYPLGDSAVFAYIGKQMTAGKLPYIDMFDHKGPLLYLIEYLGFRISPESFMGIWFLELCNLAVTVWLLLRLCADLSQKKSAGYLSVALSFLLCGRSVFEGGNFAEEYALPWISYAMLVFFRFFREKSYRKRDIVLLGIAFAAVFCLRANMVTAWLVMMPMVVAVLISEKRAGEIGSCAVLFSGGILITSIPIVVVWGRENGLKMLWDCYISFNTAYSGSIRMDFPMLLHLTGSFLSKLAPGIILTAIGLALNRKKPVYWINLVIFTFSVLMAEMSGRDYPHYMIFALPAVTVGMMGFFDRALVLSEQKQRDRKMAFLLLMCCVILLSATVLRQVKNHSRPEDNEPALNWLRENTEENTDVLVLGNSCWVYLASDRHTENRFFYQTPPVQISEKLMREFLAELREHPSDVVIDYAAGDWEQDIRDMLLSNGFEHIKYGTINIFEREKPAA